jgi:hypothetical protein
MSKSRKSAASGAAAQNGLLKKMNLLDHKLDPNPGTGCREPDWIWGIRV